MIYSARLVLSLFFVIAFQQTILLAGDIYSVTCKKGDQVMTYQVQFGGGQLMDQYTAFDPDSGKFLYLSWPREKEAPQAVQKIWNHETGEIISLYNFPGAKHPLPVIPSIDSMKVCPISGDKEFKKELLIIVD